MELEFDRKTKVLGWIAGGLLFQVVKDTLTYLYDVSIGSSPSSNFEKVLACGAGSLAFGLPALYLAQRTRRAALAEVNAAARRISEQAGDEALKRINTGATLEAFALYLRPFKLEHHFRKVGWETLAPRDAFTQLHWTPFDYKLTQDFEALGLPLISIGREVEDVGAGKVECSDEEWSAKFRVLAEHAETIVVVPGHQPGILAELRWLHITGQFRKCVFFKPLGYPQADWEETARFLEDEEGLELPEYVRNQVSFRLYDSGRAHQVLSWRVAFGKAADLGERQMRAVLRQEDPDLTE